MKHCLPTHDKVAAVSMNSQQQRPPTQDLHSSGPIKIPPWSEEWNLIRSHPSLIFMLKESYSSVVWQLENLPCSSK